MPTHTPTSTPAAAAAGAAAASGGGGGGGGGLLLPRWVVIVSGRRGAGKDFLAAAVAAELTAAAAAAAAAAGRAGRPPPPPVAVCVRSISEATKRRYAAAKGADVALLLGEGAKARAYKEAHRQGLLDFHEAEAGAALAARGPGLLLDCFLDLVRSAAAAAAAGPPCPCSCPEGAQQPQQAQQQPQQLLVVTGMREPELLELPPRCEQLLPGTQVLTVLVAASDAAKARRTPGWRPRAALDAHPSEAALEAAPRSAWGAVFENEGDGEAAARAWARGVLLPLLRGLLPQQQEAASSLDAAAPPHGGSGPPEEEEDKQTGADEQEVLQRLRALVPCVPDFPSPGIMFRNLLHLREDGLALCTQLMAARLRRKLRLEGQQAGGCSLAAGCVDAVVGIEAGGWVFAGALAAHLRVPHVPLRKRRGAPDAAADAPDAAPDAPDAAASTSSPAASALPPPLLLSPPYGGSFIRRQTAAAAATTETTAATASAAAAATTSAADAATADDFVDLGADDTSQPHPHPQKQQQQQQQQPPQQQCRQCLELWAPALRPGWGVALVDDLLASGATLGAAVRLLRAAGAEVAAMAVAAELPAHGGREVLAALGVPVVAVLQYEGL
ncbi:hypothetical protein HXX76_004993 [Chlamydomonas incerta]|uniref:adenine phosphoribosyltransferase n=1 Tax=Chlamydomonas incerta TaxID=51695 RepID=A0A835T6J3_CHLIN|nr:hypothetical protein HXX76_004993 [Chlamydomonas incerta]|eukprot:KAG2439643.1 hypothetical protein HXX76_004993 [Chlamydomonas incerta]